MVRDVGGSRYPSTISVPSIAMADEMLADERAEEHAEGVDEKSGIGSTTASDRLRIDLSVV